jgi:hypothetical protein
MATSSRSQATEREVHYGVLATLPTLALRDAYASWLSQGHVQQVLACGARHACVVALDGSSPWRVLALYRFPNRAELDRYLAQDAPGLRAQGLALFGPTTGVVFERSIGEIVASIPEAGVHQPPPPASKDHPT